MQRAQRGRVKVFNIPNLLSLTRIIILPLAVLYLFQERLMPALTVIGVMIITDILDGYLARHLSQVSELGKALDHVVDKIVVLTISYTLCCVRDLPFWVFYLLVLREAATLAVSAFMWRKRKVMAQSNWLGRIAGVLSVFTALAYLFSLKARTTLLYITLLAMLVSSLNYLRIYWPVLLNRRKSRVSV